MKIPLAKLKAILLYFCENTDPHFLGKVKLMKLFYFLDFINVKRYGVPITYDRYVNLDHGPVPSMILNLVSDLVDDPDTSILSDTILSQEVHWKEGTMLKIASKRKMTNSDVDLFSEDELKILNEVCSRFGSMNKKQIEDLSHSESPWMKTNLLETIPYNLAGQDADSNLTTEQISEIMSLMD